jgi:putative acetyltransferase
MTGPSEPSIARVAASSPEAATLLGELDAELLRRYPRTSIHGFHAGDAEDPRTVFLVARHAGSTVACGAIRWLEPGVCEVKRMYVRPEHRGRGLGRRILAALESTARDQGASVVRLETGVRQPEAIALCRAAGYREIPAFGEYASDPSSVCFEKALT